MTPQERTRQREAFDAARDEYDRAYARYQSERAKWVEVWKAAGKEAPPTTPPEQPEVLRNPKWGDCRRCFGCGLEGEVQCDDCGGTGDAPKKEKAG